MVNEQLAQMYLDLEVEGLCAQLPLCDNSIYDDVDDFGEANMQMSTINMIYEEIAAFPPLI